METKALSDIPETRNDDCKSGSVIAHDSCSEPCVTDSQLTNSKVIVQEATVQLIDTIAVTENSKCLSSDIEVNNDCLTIMNGSPIGKRKRDGDDEISDTSIPSVKKAKTVDDEDKPIVHVKYGSLTRKSKHKLEELLQQWSEWHTRHCSSSDDCKEVLEYGEGTYFPALLVGPDKSSAVTFWINKPLTSQHNKEFVAVDCKTVPTYDRSYSLEGDSKNLDAFRCFNCGSYSHSLKECTKPRDNLAVKNARTQHMSNHNQKSSNSRTPTRYYQNSPAGKYDGLVPGVLQAETQQLLGIGELDPPPWLHRMRELGYPPGYLDPEDDDNQSSGITIFADEENEDDLKTVKNENKEKPLETERPLPPRKMSVQFPGMNGLIPKNADESKWALRPRLDLTQSVVPRPIYLPQPISISPHNNHRWHTNELVPPGCEPNLSKPPFSLSPLYANQNLGNYNSPSSLSAMPMLGSPTFHNSPVAYGGSQYSSSPLSPYYPQPGLFSPTNYGTFGYERRFQ